jgi:hypothetical protein
MDPNTTLTAISVTGLAISAIGAVISQLWKDSIEIEGKIRKRLTPAGWLSLGIALLGLAGSLSAELIRANLENNQRLAEQAEISQKKLLHDQEQQWRQSTSELLTRTKQDIEENLKNTITGFRDEQKQALLSSLSISFTFESSDRNLWTLMKQADAASTENWQNEQGGVPETPYDTEEYQDSLLPLLRSIARIPDTSKSGNANEVEVHNNTVIVLLPLDSSHNSVLSFGYIDPSTTWRDKSGAAVLSNGFAPVDLDTRSGDSTPSSGAVLAKYPSGTSKYSVDWNLDPVTLANAIDSETAAIAPTA